MIDSRVMIELQPVSDEIRDKIIETAVHAKMGVLEFSAERVSLEDVFLKLTTQESQEAPL